MTSQQRALARANGLAQVGCSDVTRALDQSTFEDEKGLGFKALGV